MVGVVIENMHTKNSFGPAKRSSKLLLDVNSLFGEKLVDIFFTLKQLVEYFETWCDFIEILGYLKRIGGLHYSVVVLESGVSSILRAN